MIRIGVFYDGNFFFHVSNYYHHHHERKSRISVSGLHELIRTEVAAEEQTDARNCQVVEAHYFRGRTRASEADERGMLHRERVFDDVLARAGVTPHYLPVGPDDDRGIETWLALEALDRAADRRFDVLVLVACGSEFLPLLRKIGARGIRVVLLAWDFRYEDQNGNPRETKTAQALIDEAPCPILMHELIDDRIREGDPDIARLFVPAREGAWRADRIPVESRALGADRFADSHENGGERNGFDRVEDESTRTGGVIQNLKSGFGFITPDDGSPNVFFYHTDLVGIDFSELRIGDTLNYIPGINDRGPCARRVKLGAV
jgi:cold shock CspA family protein